MHTLWLTEVNEDLRVNAIKGVREVRKAVLGEDDLIAAGQIVKDFLDSEGYPQVVAGHTSLDTVLAAQDMLEAKSKGGARGATDIDPAAYAKEGIDPSDEEGADEPVEGFTIEAIRTALVLMHAEDGNVLNTINLVHMLRRSTDNEDFYDEVREVIFDAFNIRVPGE